jgi:lipid A 3-O-deacylase
MIFSVSCRVLAHIVAVCRWGVLGLPLVCVALAETPWASSAIDVEVGFLREVRHNTPINYTLVPTQLSWRSSPFLSHECADGSRLVVRHRLTLIGTWVQKGPESHYLGVSGSPSIEWWNKAGTLAAFGGVGGGFGVIDSRGVRGGQGQDFTLNWFARAGVERVLNPRTRLLAGLMFQHMSNGGMTKPNPGIDALGVTLGGSWSF